jgi:hypothetical protein
VDGNEEIGDAGPEQESAVPKIIAEPPISPDALVGVVILVDGHWHEGRSIKKGEMINVSQFDRDWLLQQHLIDNGDMK